MSKKILDLARDQQDEVARESGVMEDDEWEDEDPGESCAQLKVLGIKADIEVLDPRDLGNLHHLQTMKTLRMVQRKKMRMLSS